MHGFSPVVGGGLPARCGTQASHCCGLSCRAPLGGSDSKESACNAGDPDSIPGSGRSPGEGNGNRLQYSCLENPTDRGTWQVTAHGVTS